MGHAEGVFAVDGGMASSGGERRIEIVLPGAVRRIVPHGTTAGEVLPREVDGDPVVAALLDRRPVSLSAPLQTSAILEPLCASHWEGERVRRRSLGLALLEAARRSHFPWATGLGSSVGFGQRLEPLAPADADHGALARSLRSALDELVALDVPMREELWSLEEACALFSARGDKEVASLLRLWREATVPMVVCGETYALRSGPVTPSTGCLGRYSVSAHEGQLFLVYGDRRDALSSEGKLTAQLVSEHVGPKRASDMAEQHQRWLRSLDITSVGAFNELAITSGVDEVVHVSEGFHEKRVGEIASEIAGRGGRVKLVTIAGPSSSGKSTFIRRLLVQLEVVGLVARTLSIDDYYVDRDRTLRDASGEADFEALEALDLPLLQGHIAQLMEGKRGPRATISRRGEASATAAPRSPSRPGGCC
jgi:uridine kinase